MRSWVVLFLWSLALLASAAGSAWHYLRGSADRATYLLLVAFLCREQVRECRERIRGEGGSP